MNEARSQYPTKFNISLNFKGKTQHYVVKLPKSTAARQYCPKIPRVPGTLGTHANSSPTTIIRLHGSSMLWWLHNLVGGDMEDLAEVECRLLYKICKVIFVSGEAVLNGCLLTFK